ncbi:C39 family peptidase [Candidatus Uhrbacteria bacterium]|nr:C39 family peptidase [Candidatus Uhrbacteria bacterium]
MKHLVRILAIANLSLTSFIYFTQPISATTDKEADESKKQCEQKLGKCNSFSSSCSSNEDKVGVCLGTMVDSACCKAKPEAPPTNGTSLLTPGQCVASGGTCNGITASKCQETYGMIGICEGTFSNKACCRPGIGMIDEKYSFGDKACCLCGVGLGDAECVVSPNESCLNMEKTANNPVLKTYICRKLSANECASVLPGGEGLCKNKPVNAANFTGTKYSGPPIASAPKLNIPIPGLVLKPSITGENGIYNIPWLAQYIAAAYNYLISASIIAAAVMIAYGGFLYIMSSSGAGSINTAKSIISDAIIGLLLVIMLFTILKTFASGTVTNTNISIRNISPIGLALEEVNQGIRPAPGEDASGYIRATGQTVEDIAEEGSSPETPARPEPPAKPEPTPSSPGSSSPSSPGTSPPAAPGTAPSSSEKTSSKVCNPIDKIERFAQAQAPWGQKPFGKKPACTPDERNTFKDSASAPCCMLYGDSACGPTALAMVLKSYGINVTPETLGQLGIENNLRNCNSGGMSPGALINLGRYPDFQIDYSIDDTTQPRKKQKEGKNIQLLNQALKEGKPVIVLCQGCTVKRKENGKFVTEKKFGGHFMLLTGIYDDGNYALNDPSMGRYNFISKKELTNNTVLIYIRRKDNTPIPICKTT